MFKKISLFTILFSCLYAQASIADIRRLSNEQIDVIRTELQSNQALSNPDDGLTNFDQDIDVINLNAPAENEAIYQFGYNYFKREINFFDNIPTPPDFKLGPGDEIVLSLWGETNSRENFIINKEGLIYYENIGFINLSNKNLKDAETILIEELSRIYSTLKDAQNPTNLMLELGKIKSVNIYFSGQIETPGIHLIHPFSDIFSAIVQAGGVNINGSLRNVQLIRNEEIISNFDFYSFFLNGKNTFSNERILEGDTIHIPTISKRVEINGEIRNAGSYETFENESLTDLIGYAGGLQANAGVNIIWEALLPIGIRLSDDNARESKVIHIKESGNIKINDGDVFTVLPVKNLDTKVEVIGRIKNPGIYPASLNLKGILDLAGGFNDPSYRKTIKDDEIIILRKDENQFYSLEFEVPYTESDSFDLVVGDKIFVYENSFYENIFSVSVDGEVNKRGSFQLKKGMTVNDAINLADGFTELANQNAISVLEVFTFVDEFGTETEQTRLVSDANLDFELTDRSVVNILPLENVVRIVGNVYNPGLITYSGRKSIKKYINLSGGIMPNTLKNNIYIQRANGKLKTVSLFNGWTTFVKPGDTIFVPLDPDPQEFDVTAFIADLASTLANIAAILLVVDNQND